MSDPLARPSPRTDHWPTRWRRLLPLGLAVGALHLWLLPDLRPALPDPLPAQRPVAPAGHPVAVLPAAPPPLPPLQPMPPSAPPAAAAPAAMQTEAASAAAAPRPLPAASTAVHRARPTAVAPAGSATVARPASDPAAASARSTPPTHGREATGPAQAQEAVPPNCPAITRADLPPPVQVGYRLQRGHIEGEGTLRWTHDGEHYRLQLDSEVPLVGRLLRQRSEGGFDACGLAPLRHTERRLGRSERALTFLRPPPGSSAGPGELRASSRVGHLPLLPGLQDRLSWLVQLAARLQAGAATPGEQIALDVAAVGGDVQHWRLSLLARETDGLLRLRREPEEAHDTRAEVWVDPARSHWPVRVELHEARGDPLLLQMTTWEMPPR